MTMMVNIILKTNMKHLFCTIKSTLCFEAPFLCSISHANIEKAVQDT